MTNTPQDGTKIYIPGSPRAESGRVRGNKEASHDSDGTQIYSAGGKNAPGESAVPGSSPAAARKVLAPKELL